MASNEIQVTVAEPVTTIPSTPAATTTALGASLAPFTSTTPVTPGESSAAFDAANQALTSFASPSIGIYGGAPTPMSAVPESERPATSETNPNGEGGTPGAPGDAPVASGGSTPAPEPMPAPEPEPIAGPGAPNDLVATASGSNLVLRWKSSYSGTRATTYVVEAGSESGGTNLLVTTVEGGKLTYTVNDADAGTYFVRVRASNGAGTSEPSNEATVTVGNATACTAPPSVPEGLKATVNGSSMVWSWVAAKGGATSYILETASGPEGKNRVISNTGNAKTTFTIDEVMSGAYSARVRARNTCGSSEFSDKVILTIR